MPGHADTKSSKVFSYNVVFEPGATQEDVFQFSGIKRLVEMAVEGFSTTVFCYGQTGSGKTHTLTGPPGLVSKAAVYAERLLLRGVISLYTGSHVNYVGLLL